MISGILHDYGDIVKCKGINLREYEYDGLVLLRRDLGDARKMECMIAEIEGFGTIVADGVILSELGIDELTTLHHEQFTKSPSKRPRQFTNELSQFAPVGPQTAVRRLRWRREALPLHVQRLRQGVRRVGQPLPPHASACHAFAKEAPPFLSHRPRCGCRASSPTSPASLPSTVLGCLKCRGDE